MNGIYILSSELFENLNIVKFGMSTNFPERLKFYKSFLNNPFFAKIYKINDDIGAIKKIESEILKQTKDLHAKGWQTEYRNISIAKLDILIVNYLKKYNYSYKIIDSPDIQYKKRNIGTDNINAVNNERIKIQNEYFDEIITNIKKNKSVIFCAPTGFGKTNVLYRIINEYKNGKIIFLTPRKILNKQTINKKLTDSKFYNYSENSDDVEKCYENGVIVSCYQSVNKLWDFIEKNKINFDLIIFDECHVCGNCKLINSRFTKIYVTATPTKYICSLADIFISKINIYQLIKLGILCNISTLMKKIDKKENMGYLIFESMNKYNKNKCVVYVSTQNNGKILYDNMKKEKNDIEIFIYTSDYSNKIEDFEKCKRGIIITCQEISYGYDNPKIDLICMADEQHSQIQIRQICGRGLRSDPSNPSKTLHILIPLFEKFTGYKHVKKYLDFIIGECGNDIIFDDANNGHIAECISGAYNVGSDISYNGENIPSYIIEEYCTGKAGYTNFMKILKKNNVVGVESYCNMKKNCKWIPELSEIKNKYPLFNFKELNKKERYYETYEECKNVINMLIYMTYDELREIDEKLPDLCFYY
jgi:superfamily II DNA or RNA helicase